MDGLGRALEPLRDDVELTRFDGDTGDERFVVAVERRHFLVDRTTAALIEALRNARTYDEAARGMSQQRGVSISAAEVESLARDGLPRVLFVEDGHRLKHPLILRLHIFQGAELTPLLRLSALLFNRSIAVLSAVGCIVALLAALTHVSQVGTHSLSPGGWLLAILGVLLGSFLHELGHVSACHRFGARQDGIGIGFYWFMPSFYAEVHGAWRLRRLQRAAVDIGGLYFQMIYLIPVCIAIALMDDPTLPAMVLSISLFMMMHTLNPVLKFDGYWLLSDLSGSTNLHDRIANTGRVLVKAMLSGGQERYPSVRDTLLFLAFCSLGAAFFTYLFWLFGNQVGRLAASAGLAISERSFSGAILPSVGALVLAALSGLIGFRLARAVGRVFRPAN
jgi:hypothetical protein